MKKMIKNWWPLLLVAVYWVWKKTKKKPSGNEPTVNNAETPSYNHTDPFQGGVNNAETPSYNHTDPFQGGACVYGSPTI